MSIFSRLEKLERIIGAKNASDEIKTVIRSIVSPQRDGEIGDDSNHAYLPDGSWNIERTIGESVEGFEARAINEVPRDGNGFARFVLSPTPGRGG